VGDGLSLIAVFADGGADAGLGHIGRSTAVACALEQIGQPVRCWGLGLPEPLTMDGIEWQPAPLTGVPAPENAAGVVVDSYRVPAAEIAGGKPLVCMHDRGEVPPEAVLVVAPAGADAPDRLTGLDHACLRRAYWDCPPRAVEPVVGDVLVAAGGGPLIREALRFATSAHEIVPGARVRVVSGPYADVEVPPGVELLRAPPSLREAFTAADVVITAGGQTALEAAACGTPAAVVPLVENQRTNAERLARAGAAALFMPDEADERLPAILAELAPAEVRQRLADAGQRSVDGKGALRVARAIAERVSG
jgi:spore coat polysaccharide biosynthesis predicted glycosyltransferase SpsG